MWEDVAPLHDSCVLALETEPKDAGSEKSSGVVRLNTIRQIIEQVLTVCMLKREDSTY